jgi:hypothetical protein
MRTRLQSAKPGSQLVIAQFDATHPSTPCATGPHTTPQPPQLFGSDCTFAQSVPQQSWPVPHGPPSPHCCVHVVPEQTSPAGHTAAHEPQWLLLSTMLVSQPFDTLPSQSAKPGSHATIEQLPVAHIVRA